MPTQSARTAGHGPKRTIAIEIREMRPIQVRAYREMPKEESPLAKQNR